MVLYSVVEIKRIEHIDEVFCQCKVTELRHSLSISIEPFGFNALKCKYIHAYTQSLTHPCSKEENKRQRETDLFSLSLFHTRFLMRLN